MQQITFLTRLVAVVVGLRALGNIGKPFGTGSGLVFFGKLLTGWPNAVLAPILGIAMLVLAYGMWTRRRFALPMSLLYAGFVTLNVPLFLVFEGIPPAFGPFAYFAFALIAVGGAWLGVWLLAQQKDSLG